MYVFYNFIIEFLKNVDFHIKTSNKIYVVDDYQLKFVVYILFLYIG